ncbi:hypothetical protein LN984_003032 [Salmonella enterica]|nr:hypothetical protein [Salmonella enterica]
MDFRSFLVIRSGEEIEWIKNNHRAKSPVEYEVIIRKLASERGWLFIGFVGEWSRNTTKIAMRCDSGHITIPTIQNFLKGQGCFVCRKVNNGNRCRKSELDALNDAKQEAEKRGDCEIVGFENGYKNTTTKNLVVRCFDHSEYKISLGNFVVNGRGCPKCNGGIKKSELDALNDAKQEAEKRGDCEVVGFENGYKNFRERNLIIRCFKHGEYKISMSNFYCGGCGCPDCATHGYNKTKPGYIYIQKLSGATDAVKFGITNMTPRLRMNRQKLYSKLHHEMVFEWYFDDGEKAHDIEKQVKQKYRGLTCFVPRDLMEDGYTETISIDYLPVLLKDVKSLCNLHR